MSVMAGRFVRIPQQICHIIDLENFRSKVDFCQNRTIGKLT